MPDSSEQVVHWLAVRTLRPVAKREIAALGQHGLDRVRLATFHPLMVIVQRPGDRAPDHRVRR